MTIDALPLEFKSAQLDLFACQLYSTDVIVIEHHLKKHQQQNSLDMRHLLLDVSALPNEAQQQLDTILACFNRVGFQVLALRHHDDTWQAVAEAHQLLFSLTTRVASQRRRSVIEPPRYVPTVIIDKPVRAGQRIYA